MHSNQKPTKPVNDAVIRDAYAAAGLLELAKFALYKMEDMDSSQIEAHRYVLSGCAFAIGLGIKTMGDSIEQMEVANK